MPLYNLTNAATNTTGVLGFFQGVNDTLMFGWMGTMILLALVVVFFGSFSLVTGGDTKKSVIATSFLSFGLAILLQALNLIGPTTLFITLMACALSMALTWR